MWNLFGSGGKKGFKDPAYFFQIASFPNTSTTNLKCQLHHRLKKTLPGLGLCFVPLIYLVFSCTSNCARKLINLSLGVASSMLICFWLNQAEVFLVCLFFYVVLNCLVSELPTIGYDEVIWITVFTLWPLWILAFVLLVHHINSMYTRFPLILACFCNVHLAHCLAIGSGQIMFSLC